MKNEKSIEEYLARVSELKEQIEEEKKKVIPMIISEYLSNQPQTEEINVVQKIEINRKEIEATIERYKPKKDSKHVDSLCFGSSPFEIVKEIIHRTQENKFMQVHGLNGMRPTRGWDKCLFMKLPKYDEICIDILDAEDKLVKCINDIPLSEAIVKTKNGEIELVEDPKTRSIYKPVKFGTRFYRPSKSKTMEQIINDLKTKQAN